MADAPAKEFSAETVALAEKSGAARAALRGFANKLLTFDVLVDALAGD